MYVVYSLYIKWDTNALSARGDGMKYEDLKWDKCYDGIQAFAEFPNGYGASIIRKVGSYGSKDGLYELAVLHNGKLCYSTPITNDVIGYLKPNEITELLSRIEALPAEAHTRGKHER